VFPKPGELADDYPRTVAATLALSVTAANRLDPVDLAEPLLTLLSVLDPNAIPATIVITDACATTWPSGQASPSTPTAHGPHSRV
jgi:hypothetical protein